MVPDQDKPEEIEPAEERDSVLDIVGTLILWIGGLLLVVLIGLVAWVTAWAIQIG